MFIAQNIACQPIIISPNDRRASIEKENLKNKRINRIIMYSSDEDSPAFSPFTNEMLAQAHEMDSLSLYLTLSDKQNVFVTDFDLMDSLLTDYSHRMIEILHNREIDLQKSFISYKIDENINYRSILLAYYFYQTKKLSKFNDEINGSETIYFEPQTEFEIIKFSKILNHTLKGKPIKNIIAGSGMGYLDITCYDGKRLEYIPVSFLREKETKSFWFDNLHIDFENSFYKNTGDGFNSRPVELTFIY